MEIQHRVYHQTHTVQNIDTIINTQQVTNQ